MFLLELDAFGFFHEVSYLEGFLQEAFLDLVAPSGSNSVGELRNLLRARNALYFEVGNLGSVSGTFLLQDLVGPPQGHDLGIALREFFFELAGEFGIELCLLLLDLMFILVVQARGLGKLIVWVSFTRERASYSPRNDPSSHADAASGAAATTTATTATAGRPVRHLSSFVRTEFSLWKVFYISSLGMVVWYDTRRPQIKCNVDVSFVLDFYYPSSMFTSFGYVNTIQLRYAMVALFGFLVLDCCLSTVQFRHEKVMG
jgi:hypothetical protein